MVNSAGGASRDLTPGAVDDDFPSWSADGDTIAFSSTSSSGVTHVYLVGRTGSRLRRLPGSLPGDQVPAWSPAGNQLAFLHQQGSSFELVVADGASGRRRYLTHGGNSGGQAWSPNGHQLAYLSTKGANPGLAQLGDLALWITTPDGRQQRLLTDDADAFTIPSWAPDSTRLTFGRETALGTTEIYTININHGQPTRITTLAGSNVSPNWQPATRPHR